MLNQLTVVGRLSRIGQDYKTLQLAVQRSYKNQEGVYETDFFTVKLDEHMRNSIKGLITKGDSIGIKGRLECTEPRRGKITIAAEKITLLSSRS